MWTRTRSLMFPAGKKKLPNEATIMSKKPDAIVTRAGSGGAKTTPRAAEDRKAATSRWLNLENEPDTGPSETCLMITRIEAIDAIAMPRSSKDQKVATARWLDFENEPKTGPGEAD